MEEVSSRAQGRTIRLLILISNAGRGGAEKRAGEVLAHLDPGRFRLRLLVLEESGPLVDFAKGRGVEVHTVARKRWFPARLIERVGAIRRLIAADRPDLIHAWDHVAAMYARIPGAVPAGVPVIVGFNSSRILSPRLRLLERWLCDRTTLYAPNSQAGASYLERSFPIPPKRIRVIRQGMSLDDMGDGAVRRRAIRREWDVSTAERLVGMVGKLTSDKNPRLLVDVAERVLARSRNVRFVLVGSGPLEEELRKRVSEKGLESGFLMIPEHPDGPVLPAAFDVGVLTSEAEGFPNVVLEYMYWRKPIVVTDVGDCRFAVRDGREGRVVPARDVEALSDAVLSFLRRPEYADRLGRQARRRLEERFTIERYTHDLKGLYEGVLAREDMQYSDSLAGTG